MKRFLVLSILAFLPAVPVTAQGQAPDALVKSVTHEVLSIIKQDKDIQAGSTKKTIALIEDKVLPHFNFTRMTALAMGANWRKATPDQQKALIEQFRTLLVRTYSTALTSYRDQAIDFKPLRAQSGETEVTVRSEVKLSGTEPISIDYSMEKGNDAWKVYDVTVGGVSLVTTYRDTFAAEVRNGGVDGLIKALTNKNRQLETKHG
jgi:phospholipid transport system substrate-binding protein